MTSRIPSYLKRDFKEHYDIEIQDNIKFTPGDALSLDHLYTIVKSLKEKDLLGCNITIDESWIIPSIPHFKGF